MKYEIEIDGLPEGWEICGNRLDGFVANNDGNSASGFLKLSLRRKVRKYDWSKTLDDVLVVVNSHPGFYTKAGIRHSQIDGIAPVWQPNIHGKCPVDPEASIVRVRAGGGREQEDSASAFIWDNGIITAWQFLRLADGYEW